MPKHDIKHCQAVDSLIKLADIYRDARASWAGELREQLAIRIDLAIEEACRKAVQEADAMQAEAVGPEKPVDATVHEDDDETQTGQGLMAKYGEEPKEH